jgi:cytochrome c oxidase assembly protein subunit 15
MKLTAIAGLILVMALVSLSSYLRLDHSGIGCTPWPDCYGNIGEQGAEPTVESAYERLVAEARQPMSWARPMHRLIASVLGLVVLGLVGMSLRAKRQRSVSFMLLGLTVFLAWLGIYSEGLHSPAVVMGNLGGGFAMLGLFGWLVFNEGNTDSGDKSRQSNLWVSMALALLCVQILLGGLTSANFAASACQTIPHCHGMWLPGSDVSAAFNLSRSLTINNEGFVTGGSERAAIHQLHRIVALITAAFVLFVGALAIQKEKAARPIGVFVCLVVALEFLIGVAAVRTNIPIGIAVAHNWLAGMLLLGLLKLRSTQSV